MLHAHWWVPALLALILGIAAGCGEGSGCAAGEDGGPLAGDDPVVARLAPGAGPALTRPARDGYDHDLFMVVDGRPGHSYRIRLAEDRPPLMLGADFPTFYDGTSLLRFGRSVNQRTVPLAGGGTYTETRARLWEDDGLGSGHWIHRHGLMKELEPDLGSECHPAEANCTWHEASGLDVVSITGNLRGMREWSGGYTGGDRGEARLAYRTHDRFGDLQDPIRMYPGEHRELIRQARERWDQAGEDARSCYRFDYRSGYLRPAPGGLVWVMFGHALYESCQGTALSVEVPAPAPAYGGVDVTHYGEPGGDKFHFLEPELWVEPGNLVLVRFAAWTVELPGPLAEDPPLAAIRLLPAADILEAHREPLQRAYTELHDLPLLAGPAPTVDGALADWDGQTLLLLDALTNVSNERHGRTWRGPEDATLAVGVLPTADGWVVAARVLDDVLVTDREGRRDQATDHLQVWLRTADGWVELAVHPGAEPGAAQVVPRSLTRSGELPSAIPEAASPAGVTAAWQPLADREGAAAGMDFEVAIPAAAVRIEDGRFGLRVLYADADGDSTLEGDLLIGTGPALADTWVVLEAAP